MAVRYYLLPLLGTGTRAAPRRPAYLAVDVPGIAFLVMDYGAEPWCLVRLDVTVAQHAALTAHLDVLAFPLALNTAVGLGLAAAQTALESMNIPADWLRATHLWSDILRLVATIFQFTQRLQVFQPGPTFPVGTTLDTRWNELPISVRNAMQAAAVNLGYSVTSLNGAVPLRTILKALGDQFRGSVLLGADRL